CVGDLGHDRRERGDGAGAQIVAVAEAAREHERVDALEVVRAMPEGDGLGAGETDRALCVAVVERAGEGDDPDAGGHSTTSMPTTSSMTEFERISSATFLTVSSVASSAASTVSSNRLPMRTPVMPPISSRLRAPATALPCGSS